MLIYEITVKHGAKAPFEVASLVSIWETCGWITDSGAVVECGEDDLKVFVESLTTFELEETWGNQHSMYWWQELNKLGCSFQSTLAGGRETDLSSQKPPKGYVLCCLGGGNPSPLRDIDDFSFVPLTWIPGTYHDSSYNDVLSWLGDYEAVIRLWEGAVKCQRSLKDEFNNPKSMINQTGITLCKRIEALTGIPTYYYVWRCNERRSLKQEIEFQIGIDFPAESELIVGNSDYQFINHKERLVSNIVPSVYDRFMALGAEKR